MILGENNSVGSITVPAGLQSVWFYSSQSGFNIGVDTLEWDTSPASAPTSGELGITVVQEL